LCHGRLAITETDAPSPPAALWPFPDYRDLYILVAGVIIGVILSPAVLGQLAPAGWESELFGGAGLERQLQQLNEQWQADQQTLAASDVSQAAVTERREQYLQQRGRLVDALTAVRNERAGRMLVALMLTLGAVMVIEPFLSPQPDQASQRAAVPQALPRLKTVRYALIALFIALLLARPSLLASSTLLFAALLIAVALGVGLVPLGKRRA
jgi:hypothetical protein